MNANSMSFGRQCIDYIPIVSTGYNIYECSTNEGTAKKIKLFESNISKSTINDDSLQNFYIPRRLVASVPLLGNAVVLITDIAGYAARKIKEGALSIHKKNL